MIRAVLLFALGSLLTAPCLEAGGVDREFYYVNGATGNDTNDGLTPATAWQHVSYAVAQVALPSGSTEVPPIREIHIAPGTYSFFGGETFPLTVTPRVQLIGDAGADVTHIDASGAGFVSVVSMTLGVADFVAIDAETQVRGLTLEGGLRGVQLSTDWPDVQPQLSDLVITRCSDAGAYQRQSEFSPGSVDATWQNVELFGNETGAFLSGARSTWTDCSFHDNVGAGLHQFGGYAELIDCSVRSNGSHGVRLSATNLDQVISRLKGCEIRRNSGSGISVDASSDGHAVARLERCLIDRNAADGIRLFATNFADVDLRAENSTLTRNALAGLRMLSLDGLSFSGELLHCTVAGNAGAGIDTVNGDSVFQTPFDLLACIIAWNADDFALNTEGPVVGVQSCLIRDGDFAGGLGNIAGDPAFVNMTDGNFRLSYGSPAADAVATPTVGGDLEGRTRPIDSNLDTLEQVDMGAYELATLEAQSAAVQGSDLLLILRGERGDPALLLAGLPVPPIASPFGQFDLSPSFSIGVHAAGPAEQIVLGVPLSPGLLGLSLGLQALTASAAAPLGGAFSSPVIVRIESSRAANASR